MKGILKRFFVVSLILALVMFTSTYALLRWAGTDNVENIKSNLILIKDRLVSQKGEIEKLENQLEGSVSKEDHQAIIDQMQERYDNDIAAKDKIIQDDMIIKQQLNAEIADLTSQLQLALEDVIYIDNEIIAILADTE